MFHRTRRGGSPSRPRVDEDIDPYAAGRKICAAVALWEGLRGTASALRAHI